MSEFNREITPEIYEGLQFLAHNPYAGQVRPFDAEYWYYGRSRRIQLVAEASAPDTIYMEYNGRRKELTLQYFDKVFLTQADAEYLENGVKAMRALSSLAQTERLACRARGARERFMI